MGSNWYQDAILYEVDVRAFYDSNGDGIGDVPGLIDKLHYVRELGVTALLLGPRQHCWLGNGSAAGPSKPVAQDFERLVHAAHASHIHVITELFVDQASDQALDADLLPTRAGFESAIRRWLDAGVDGVKIEVAPTLVDLERSDGVTLGAHGIVKEVRALIDKHYAERVIIVEANRSLDDATAYFGRGDQCHMALNMSFMPRLLMAVREENRTWLVDALRRTTDTPASCQWVVFLRHHEELGLETCTDSEREALYETYAPEPRMRSNTGIRRRLAPLFENDRRRVELAFGLMFSLPGSPMIYYGDEIGMGDNVHLDDCNGLRTPMQWSSGRNAGFSLADSARLTVPANAGPIYGYEVVNVEAQKRQSSSLFNWMRRLIAVRRQHSAFSRGALHFMEPGNKAILAYVRRHQDERILVVANLSGKEQSVDLALSACEGAQPIELIGGTRFRRIDAGSYSMTLRPYECFWLLLSRRVTRPSPSSDAAVGRVAAQPDAIVAPAARADRRSEENRPGGLQ
jgi:maltose alpha-D-glucosyltransferase/alpha-amylase